MKNFENRGYASVKGIILNRRNVESERKIVEDFAERRGLKIIAEIPRSPEIHQYEQQGVTVVEGDSELLISQKYLELARDLLDE